MKSVRITKADLEIHDNLAITRFDEGGDILIEDWMEISVKAPFRSFGTLDDALNWVREKLRDVGA